MLDRHFTTKEIKPAGWLRRQLEVQAASLSGNLDKVWSDVRDSRWIGGDREGWERVPYWLDGFIPLAWLLDDEDMKKRARAYIEAILAGQQPDGWICPCSYDERGGYDMWALYLICKVLTVYYDCTADERIPGVIFRALRNLSFHVKDYPIKSWAHARWFECLIPIYFTYDRYGEPWLLELARTLRSQGMNYAEVCETEGYRNISDHWTFEYHIVNQGMALKAGALASVADGKVDTTASDRMLSLLMEYHGTAVGHFNGDECLAGFSPIRGTELCSVVEAMYSYEILHELTGDPIWADRCEKLAFNALPGTCSADMWTHQYDQMTNQIVCKVFDKTPFGTNGVEANIFGLEPNYGCCTANFNQGWPKFALSAYYRKDSGVAVGVIAPSVLETEIGGAKVKIDCATRYPFGDTLTYTVTADKPVNFPLALRIPSCAASAEIDGKAADTGYTVIEREWNGSTVITVKLRFENRFIARPTGMFSLERGPLVYTVDIGEEEKRLEYVRNNVERKYPYCDYEIYPTTDWQYTFAGEAEDFAFTENDIAKLPFDPLNPPTELSVEVVPINWGYAEGFDGVVARETPVSLEPTGEKKIIRFKPYGASRLHMTELPRV